jgi:hypothetical protein
MGHAPVVKAARGLRMSGMWPRLKRLLERTKRGIPGAFANAPVDPEAPEIDVADAGEPPGPVVFHRYYKYVGLFSFNMGKLDINLLMYPGGPDADRYAVLLLVYGCEEILRLPEVNEAYVCRKLGETRDKLRVAADEGFEAVYARTEAFDAQRIVDACVANGDLERVSVVAGGDVRLSDALRPVIVDMAVALNDRARMSG